MRSETPEFNMVLGIETLKDLMTEVFGRKKLARIVYNKNWDALRITDIGKKFGHKYRYQIPRDIFNNPRAQVRIVEPQGHVASHIEPCCLKVKMALEEHIGEVPDFFTLVLRAFPGRTMGDYDEGFGYVKFTLNGKRYAVSSLILIKSHDVKTTVREIKDGCLCMLPTENSERVRKELIKFFERIQLIGV